MSLSDDLKSTLPKFYKMHEVSSGLAHTDANYDSDDASAWAKLVDREGDKDEHDRMRPKREQIETPAKVERKPHVDNVVSSHAEVESVFARQIGSTTE